MIKKVKKKQVKKNNFTIKIINSKNNNNLLKGIHLVYIGSLYQKDIFDHCITMKLYICELFL